MIRRSVLIALRDAARRHLTPEERAAVGRHLAGDAAEIWRNEAPLSSEWYPDAVSVDIVEALHGTLPLARFNGFVGVLVDTGFGRLRKFFLGLATPLMLAARAPEFWRYDHQTGEMLAVEQGGGVLVTIRDHPYVGSEACRALMAEYIRYALNLTRVRSAIVARSHDENELRILVRWT